MVRFPPPIGVAFWGCFRGGSGDPILAPIWAPIRASIWDPDRAPFGGPFRAPRDGANFDLFFSASPNKRICLLERSQNFHVLKKGVLGGVRFGLRKDPPQRSDLGSDLGSSSGPRSGSDRDPSGVPFGAPRRGPCSGSETRPKPYIYNAFGDFRTFEKVLKSESLEGPHLASRGVPKISEKGVPNFRKRCNYNTLAISGGPFGGPFWGSFRGPFGGPF